MKQAKTNTSTSTKKVTPSQLGYFSRLKRFDPLSWFFAFLTVLLLAVVIFTAVHLIKSNASVTPPTGMDYYDNYMNFMIHVPTGWEVTTPSEESVKAAIAKATDGVLFDMNYHHLPAEIVPLALVDVPFEEGMTMQDRLRGSRFMTLAFRGADKNFAVLDDKEKLKSDFQALLAKLEYSNVQVTDVIDLSREAKDGDLFGVVIKATAEQAGVKLNYVQYLEPAGANLLVTTYGSTESYKEQLKTLKEIIPTITYLEGGQAYPKTLQEKMKNTEKPAAQGTLKDSRTGQTVNIVTGDDPELEGNHDHDGDGYDDHTGAPVLKDDDSITPKVDSTEGSGISVKDESGKDIKK